MVYIHHITPPPPPKPPEKPILNALVAGPAGGGTNPATRCHPPRGARLGARLGRRVRPKGRPKLLSKGPQPFSDRQVDKAGADARVLKVDGHDLGAQRGSARSSRPHRSPNQTDPHVVARVVALRRERKVGPVQLVGLLAEEGITLPASTVYRVLVRHGISRLRDLDVTGEDLREPVVRYEWAKPGDMVHVDVKKLGRIPDGGGWRVHGRGSAQDKATGRAKTAGARAGYVYLHSAVDDHSRLAYTEELPDEKGATAAGFWARAVKFFRRHGIRRIRRVLTDNGSCYRSWAFAAALAASRTRHKRTRPYRPQTNGKVERYHRTLAREWAYARA